VQKAGQLLKPLPAHTHRVLVLLTDGRIDSHQVCAALIVSVSLLRAEVARCMWRPGVRTKHHLHVQ
jgi:hypothetical protein